MNPYAGCIPSSLKPLSFAIALSLTAPLISSSTSAAEPSDSQKESAPNYALEEVMVTARKREESLQDSPVAISVMSSDAIDQMNLQNLQDIGQSTPGLLMPNGSGTGNAANPSIRGVRQSQIKETTSPGVAIYMDDVYLGVPQGALLDIVDLQSVQVLRGPQGTLFGKNATGGAIVLTTNRPTEEFSGKVKLRLGNLGRHDEQLVINAPITDTLFTRLSLSSARRDGYSQQISVDPITFEKTGELSKWDDEDKLQAYFQARWLASDNVTVDVASHWAKQREKGRGMRCIYAVPPLDEPTLNFALNLVTGTSYGDACEAYENYGDNEFATALDGRYENDISSLSATVTWDINDNYSVKSISAWRAVDSIQTQEIDGTIIAMIDTEQMALKESDQYSQEFQLNFSLLDSKLNGVTGFYFYNEQTRNGREDTLIGPFPVTLFTYPGADIFWQTNRSQERSTDNTSYSLFSQVDYEFSDEWVATAGLRWTKETRGLRVDRRISTPAEGSCNDITDIGLPCFAADIGLNHDFIDLILPGNNPLNPVAKQLLPPNTVFILNQGDVLSQKVHALPDYANSPESDSVKNISWTPMVSLQYRSPTKLLDALNLDDGMMYATYSKGFKAGGVVSEKLNSLSRFEPEEVDNFEVGFKLETWNRRIRVNAAAFYMDYDDIQLTVVQSNPDDVTDVNVYTSNAGRAEVSGVELEGTFLVTENWLINMSGEFTEARYKEFNAYENIPCAEAGIAPADCPFPLSQMAEVEFDRSMEEFPSVPKWTLFIGTQYTFTTPIGHITPRIDWSRTAEISGHFDHGSWETGLWRTPQHTIINSNIRWDSPDEHFSVVAWVKNLEDKYMLSSGAPIPDTLGGGSSTTLAPRTYGIDLEYRF